MNYSVIKPNDISSGDGVRVSLFVSGCRNHCKGCFQPETWDFAYGVPFTESTMLEIVAALDKPQIQGLTILGGEPFEEENQQDVARLVSDVRNVFDKQKDIWIYSGYTYEELTGEKQTEYTKFILENVDVLVDGKFDENRTVPNQFRGSSNQRILYLTKK